MLNQTLLPERIFGLAVVEGRRTVRPGAVVRFRFRARNASEIATPSARLTFALPPGWSALESLEAEIPPVRPGGEHIAWFTARPDLADETTALSRFQAVLQLDEMVLGSNVVTVRVTGSARFSAPASGVRIEPAGANRLRVATDIVNEGDAAARNVRLIVPPPPGYRAASETTSALVPELKPGASYAFAYEMEPVAPASPIVRVDDAYVTFDGGRFALMTGATHLLAPNLLVPEIASTRAATRLDTMIRITNDGWVPARDVRVVVELPAGWRILRGTMLADGAPAVIRRDPGAENGVTLALPFVPARGAVAVSVVSSATRPRIDGALVVRCGDHTVEAPIPEPSQRALRLDARPETPFAVPGLAIPIAIDAFNNGETAETVAIALDGEVVWRGDIRAGNSVAFVARYQTPADLLDGDVATATILALAADDEALASVGLELRVIDRPWIAVDDVQVEGNDARIVVRNVGATTAHDLRIDADADIRIAELAPGETHSFALTVAQTRHAQVLGADGSAVPIAWDIQPEAVPVEAELIVGTTARAGQRLDIRLRAVAAGSLETLRVRPRPHSGAVYVAGSTSVNGYAIVDGVDGPPLLLGDGLALYDIPAGTIAEIGWSLLPRTPGDLVVSVDVEANGSPVELGDAHVRITDATPFGARPSALPFHIDAATVADPAAAPMLMDPPGTLPSSEPPPAMPPSAPAATLPPGPPAPPSAPAAPFVSAPPATPVAPPAASAGGLTASAATQAAIASAPPRPAPAPNFHDVQAERRLIERARQAAAGTPTAPLPAVTTPVTPGTFVLQHTLDEIRIAAIRRVLRGSRTPGLVGHLPAIAVLLPTAIGADPTVSAALGAAGDAIRSAYERLFVKLRIPGYGVTPYDLEDNAMRRELTAFVRVAATGSALPPYGSADLRVTISTSALAAARDALADAPLGGPQTLVTIAALLPRGGDGGLAPLGAYVDALANELAQARGLTQEAFAAHVTSHRSEALDAAREAAATALDAPGLLSGG